VRGGRRHRQQIICAARVRPGAGLEAPQPLASACTEWWVCSAKTQMAPSPRALARGEGWGEGWPTGTAPPLDFANKRNDIYVCLIKRACACDGPLTPPLSPRRAGRGSRGPCLAARQGRAGGRPTRATRGSKPGRDACASNRQKILERICNGQLFAGAVFIEPEGLLSPSRIVKLSHAGCAGNFVSGTCRKSDMGAGGAAVFF
jgi:hypothetical protein